LLNFNTLSFRVKDTIIQDSDPANNQTYIDRFLGFVGKQRGSIFDRRGSKFSRRASKFSNRSSMISNGLNSQVDSSLTSIESEQIIDESIEEEDDNVADKHIKQDLKNTHTAEVKLIDKVIDLKQTTERVQDSSRFKRAYEDIKKKHFQWISISPPVWRPLLSLINSFDNEDFIKDPVASKLIKKKNNKVALNQTNFMKQSIYMYRKDLESIKNWRNSNSIYDSKESSIIKSPYEENQLKRKTVRKIKSSEEVGNVFSSAVLSNKLQSAWKASKLPLKRLITESKYFSLCL